MLVLLAASFSVPTVAADCDAVVLVCTHEESNSEGTWSTFCVADAGGEYRAICYGEDHFANGNECTHFYVVGHDGIFTCDGSEETTCLTVVFSGGFCRPVGAGGVLSIIGIVIGVVEDRVLDDLDADGDGYPDAVEAAVCGNFTARDFINTATVPGTCVTTDDYDP